MTAERRIWVILDKGLNLDARNVECTYRSKLQILQQGYTSLRRYISNIKEMPTTNAETDAHSCAMIPDQIVRTFNIECTYPSSDMSDVNVATSGTYIAMSTWSINPS
jgi:hypothetical protein